MKYRITRRYTAGTGERTFAFQEGDTVNLEDSAAEWLERDSPGLLERVIDAPPKDRQMKPAAIRTAREETE
jgi:hypothetical protein